MSRFRRRLMGLAALRQAAADDFVRVEYIENTSNAYIDTGVIPNSKYYNVEIKFLNSGNKASTCLYGARNSYTTLFYSFWPNADTLKEVRATNGTNGKWSSSDQSIDTNNKVSIFKLNENTANLTVEGVEHTWNIANSTYGATKKLFLFNCNDNNSITPSWNFIGRVYYFKIYYNGVLVRDFIPMYKKSTKQYGLWDRVSEEFYVSPNGTNFIGGEPVIADADDNLYYIKNYIYINSTQQQYIILKPFTNTDNVELKVHPIGGTNCWFGDRSARGNQRRLQIASWSNTRLDIAYNQFPSISYPNGIMGKDITLKLYDKKFYVNNELLYTFTSNLSTTNNTNLGRVYNTGRATNSRFYWFKWWNGNKDLVYDLIPVQRCSDGVWGFFDKVSLVFHPSDGSAQFTGG